MAYFPKKKRGVKKTGAKRPVYRKRKVTKPSKAFVQKVQRIIHKDVETKMVTFPQAFTSYNSAISAVGDIGQLIQNISQGTSESARIGDQVKAMKLDLRGHLIMNTGYNTLSDTRIAVRMFIVQPKNFSDYNSIFTNAGTWLSNLLKRGNTTTGFTGAISDLYSDVNSDAITCYYDKVTYLTAPYIAAGATITPIDIGRQSVRFFRKTIKLRKTLKYDININGGLQPTNYCPVLLIGYAHLDGSAADTLSTQVGAQWNCNLYYEDA